MFTPAGRVCVGHVNDPVAAVEAVGKVFYSSQLCSNILSVVTLWSAIVLLA